ncbi:GNAT family N-acetyltransferase [Marinibaculum pumilum]|uniref:GNAT family N-acetyltransferase n=1 Tax=Marinibaculum pumilum TaxID=1766165 RepID=A0ABV7L8J8_9PROT
MSEIRRNTEAGRFELEVDGHTAFIEYRPADNHLVLVHTEVPSALGGQGIGTRLARGSFDLLRRSGEKVELRCDFLRRFVEKHPDYRDLLA